MNLKPVAESRTFSKTILKIKLFSPSTIHYLLLISWHSPKVTIPTHSVFFPATTPSDPEHLLSVLSGTMKTNRSKVLSSVTRVTIRRCYCFCCCFCLSCLLSSLPSSTATSVASSVAVLTKYPNVHPFISIQKLYPLEEAQAAAPAASQTASAISSLFLLARTCEGDLQLQL